MYNIDLEEYNNGKYKYGIGELFDGDINSNIKKGEKSIFDTESKNYHFYPDDMKKMEEWNKVIEKKRGAIVKLIENDDNELMKRNPKLKNITVNSIKKTQNDFNKAWSDKNDVIYFYVNNNGTLSGVEDCRLFKYIAALKNGVLYELNFMKFFISKDNKANCIVKDIQFDRVIDDSTSIIMKKRVNRNEICYPTSYRGQSTDTLEKLLEKNQGKSFFYNPQISFDIAEADILEKFVEFIDICDNRNN